MVPLSSPPVSWTYSLGFLAANSVAYFLPSKQGSRIVPPQGLHVAVPVVRQTHPQVMQPFPGSRQDPHRRYFWRPEDSYPEFRSMCRLPDPGDWSHWTDPDPDDWTDPEGTSTHSHAEHHSHVEHVHAGSSETFMPQLGIRARVRYRKVGHHW